MEICRYTLRFKKNIAKTIKINQRLFYTNLIILKIIKKKLSLGVN